MLEKNNGSILEDLFDNIFAQFMPIHSFINYPVYICVKIKPIHLFNSDFFSFLGGVGVLEIKIYVYTMCISWYFHLWIA